MSHVEGFRGLWEVNNWSVKWLYVPDEAFSRLSVSSWWRTWSQWLLLLLWRHPSQPLFWVGQCLVGHRCCLANKDSHPFTQPHVDQTCFAKLPVHYSGVTPSTSGWLKPQGAGGSVRVKIKLFNCNCKRANNKSTHSKATSFSMLLKQTLLFAFRISENRMGGAQFAG